MMTALKNFELANLGMVWFVCGIGRELFDLFQRNEAGFGARIFIIVVLVLMTVLVCKFLIPWIAGLAVHYIAGIWIHAVPFIKWSMSSTMMNRCTWICRWVCWAGHSQNKKNRPEGRSKSNSTSN